MNDVEALRPWDIVMGVIADNGYSVEPVARDFVLEVSKGNKSCLVYVSCVSRLMDDPNKLDQMFLRIESDESNKDWIPLGLHDPSGFDLALEQLDIVLR